MIRFHEDEDSCDAGLEVWASKDRPNRVCFQVTKADGSDDGTYVSLDAESIVALVAYLNAHQIRNMQSRMGHMGHGGCMGDADDE